MEVVIMTELEELSNDIEILRESLESLIKEKNDNFIDNEVIAESRLFNDALNHYSKLRYLS